MEDESDDKDDTKRKSRNLSEKKRRDQFNTLVNDLSALISTSNRKMDKSTVLKSTIAFLKHHNEVTDKSKEFEIQQDWKPSFLTNDEFTHLMLEALDGFIIVFSSSGAIFYASESITSLLGYLPCDLLNMTIFDLTYERDHESLNNIFRNPTPVIEPLQTDITATNQMTFHAHLKRGGIDKVDANAYEFIKFVGYFRNDANIENLPSLKNTHTSPIIYKGSSNQPLICNDEANQLIFVGTGRIQMPQLIREMSAIDPTRNEFTSKHSLEWKFLFLDHRAPPIIGYMPFEVLGTSGYDYYHFEDLDGIVKCHEELLQKGDGKSCYYRFLTKGQQWIWLHTEFFVSYHQYNSKPDYVVCTHKVVSYAEVIKDSKKDKKNIKPLSVTVPAAKTSTMTLKDTENNTIHTPSASTAAALQTQLAGSGTIASAASTPLLCDLSPTLEAASMWPSFANSQATPAKTSRPPSSYGNISSTGISPNLKRKRYFHHNRGNDSDSTSMSADSGTSRHSLLTHISSQSRKRQTTTHVQQQQQQQQLQQQQHSHSNQQHRQQATSSHLIQPEQQQSSTPQQHQQHQKLLPILQQHSLLSNTTCQFPQPAFPLRTAPIVGQTFLEPPQFLTAIPVQPVIAPFPVSPVPLSPLTMSTHSHVGVATETPPLMLAAIPQQQAELLPTSASAAVVMTPTQTQLQDQLQRKHDELQQLIMQQQDELRIVSEQLLLARYTLMQPALPLNYNNASGGSARNFNSISHNHNNNLINSSSNNNNNSIEQHFNQFGYALGQQNVLSTHEQQQQLLLQHHQQQQQSQPQQHLHAQTQQQLLHHSEQLQQQQHQQQHHQQEQTQQQQHQQQQNLLSRSVPDLEQFAQDDIDAFLNLSPLQSLGSQTCLNQHTPISSNHNNNNNHSGSNNHQSSQSLNHNFGLPQDTSPTNNEDSLLSYMQMSADPSPGLNFQMGISDDGSESHSRDAKILQTQHHHQQQQQQQQSHSFFSTNPFQALNQSSSNHMPNDLEILPYQLSQEQSQNLFNVPYGTENRQ